MYGLSMWSDALKWTLSCLTATLASATERPVSYYHGGLPSLTHRKLTRELWRFEDYSVRHNKAQHVDHKQDHLQEQKAAVLKHHTLRTPLRLSTAL